MSRRVNKLCECGCGERVSARSCRWVWGHIPPAQRSRIGRVGGTKTGYMVRRAKFKADLDRMVGRSVTRGEMFAVLASVYERGYNTGHKAGHRAALARKAEAA